MVSPTEQRPARPAGRRRRRLALVAGSSLAVVLLAVAAVRLTPHAATAVSSGAPSSGAAAQPAAAAAPTTPGAVQTPDDAATRGSTGAAVGGAERFSISTAHGATVAVPGRPTVLFFMTSTGCGDCVEEAAVLAKLTPRWSDKVAVVGVEMDPDTPTTALDAFSSDLGQLPFPLTVDDGSLVSRFAVQSLDTTVVLDAGGHEVYRDVVPSTSAQLVGAVARAGVQT